MSQRRTITYTCDHCDKEVARKKDLVRFAVQTGNWTRAVSFDVCADCESVLLNAVSKFLPDDEDAATLSRFHRALDLGARVEFFKPKIKFMGAPHVSPVDCVLLVFDARSRQAVAA